jgi:hypothetical protein
VTRQEVWAWRIAAVSSALVAGAVVALGLHPLLAWMTCFGAGLAVGVQTAWHTAYARGWAVARTLTLHSISSARERGQGPHAWLVMELSREMLWPLPRGWRNTSWLTES